MKRRYTPRHSESGYALLMVVFFAAVMLISVAVAAPSVLTQGKREKEDELIWRGGQYARAVRFYYRKNGRFPHSLEDLTKAQNEIHFLRKAYKDPMNKEDGSWRLIYVGPGGQLIGSLKQQQAIIRMPAAGGPGVAQAGTGSLQAGAGTGIGQTAPSSAPGGQQPASGATGTGAGAQGTDTSASGANPQPVPTGDTPTIVGGSIIGVGSKINLPSVIIWD